MTQSGQCTIAVNGTRTGSGQPVALSVNVGPNAFEIETFRDRFLGKGRKTLEPVFKYAVKLVGLIPSLSEDVHLGGLEVREGPLVGTAGAAGGGGPLRLRPAFYPGVQQYSRESSGRSSPSASGRSRPPPRAPRRCPRPRRSRGARRASQRWR